MRRLDPEKLRLDSITRIEELRGREKIGTNSIGYGLKEGEVFRYERRGSTSYKLKVLLFSIFISKDLNKIRFCWFLMNKEELEQKILNLKQKLQILQWDADRDQINPAKRFQLEQLKKEYEELQKQLEELEAKEQKEIKEEEIKEEAKKISEEEKPEEIVETNQA